MASHWCATRASSRDARSHWKQCQTDDSAAATPRPVTRSTQPAQWDREQPSVSQRSRSPPSPQRRQNSSLPSSPTSKVPWSRIQRHSQHTGTRTASKSGCAAGASVVRLPQPGQVQGSGAPQVSSSAAARFRLSRLSRGPSRASKTAANSSIRSSSGRSPASHSSTAGASAPLDSRKAATPSSSRARRRAHASGGPRALSAFTSADASKSRSSFAAATPP
mmetsp:Transcript_21042/g.72687  ORF Transcript_21042/g.72687 Transcript_21042/m.72687 type:complete len:220 (+) Transcript_21042:632-1291(+)